MVLCERGIRTFEPATRNTLDLSAVPIVQATSHLPVIVDPSHAAGRKDLVVALARAGIAVGADGVCVRAGHHCTQPVMDALGVAATTRASFYLYTVPEEIDRMIESLHRVRGIFA